MASKVTEYCRNAIGDSKWKTDIFEKQIADAATRARSMTAWRLEGTLREFAKFEPVNCWFRYPIHVPDESGALSDIEPETEKPVWEKAKEERKRKAKKKKEEARNKFEISFANLELSGEPVSIAALAEAIDTKIETVKGWFGEGKAARVEYKKCFEKYLGEDGKAYIRRKESDTDGTD